MSKSQSPKFVVHMLPTPRLMGVHEASTYIGISARALEAKRADPTFPQPMRIGRRILWDRKLLDLWVDAVTGAEEVIEDHLDQCLSAPVRKRGFRLRATHHAY